jgi:fumarate reductase flavoprotein subunit
MLHTLFQTSHKYPSIKRCDEFFCADLVVEDVRVQGVVVIDITAGEFYLFECINIGSGPVMYARAM